MQATNALLKEQLLREQKARHIAEANKEILSQQVVVLQSALEAANQKVCA